MSEIIDMFYHQKSKSVPEIIQQAKLIQERLGNWKSELPPELKLISFKNDPPGSDIPEMLRVFRVQSLALQILYYNAQIILYRPFLTPRKKSSAHRFRSPGIPSVIGDTIVENHDLAFYQICRTQCWTAAMETVRLIEYRDILKWSGRTPVAPFIGMHSFTAGSVLCLFAIACPLTATAQESKKGLGTLIQMLRVLDSPAILCKQSAKFTRDLLHLVLSEEMKVLTSENLSILGDARRYGASNSSTDRTQPLDVLESLESDGNSRMSRQTLTLVDHNELASSSIPVGQDPIGTEPLVLDSEMCLHMEDLPRQSIDSFEDAVTTLQSGEFSCGFLYLVPI